MTAPTLRLVQRASDLVGTALWALGAALAIYFALFVMPDLPRRRADQERIRAREIAAENGLYCQGWGLRPGSHEHTLCLMDLQEFRARIEQRMVEDGGL